MATINSNRKSTKSIELTCGGAKRSSAADTSSELNAKRSCQSSCVANQEPMVQSVEKDTSCRTPIPATASNPSPTPAQPDEELQALLPFFTPSEVRMLGFLEMPPAVLRGECQRCRGRDVESTPGVLDECLCRVLAEDHYFRDSRASLARQLRETARQRRAAHITTNRGHSPLQNDTGCLGFLNRQEKNGTVDRGGGTWDWLTQLQACMPSKLQQTSSTCSQQLPVSSPSPPFLQPATSSLGQLQVRDAAFGVGEPMGTSGRTSLVGNRSQFPDPLLQQQPPPPNLWGYSGSTLDPPTVPHFSAPQGYPGQQTSYGQQSNYAQHSAFGQQPSYQQANFGQGQQPNYMQSNNCPLQQAPAQQPPQQPPQQPGQGGNFGYSTSGQGNGGGGGSGGAYMSQEQFMGAGQFTSNQYGGLAVQTGGYLQPQPQYVGCPHFVGSPNQYSMYPSQQPPSQQYFVGPQGACPIGAPCPMNPHFLQAPPTSPHTPFNPHVPWCPPQVH